MNLEFLDNLYIKLFILGPQEFKDEVYFAHMGRAWARLASYYYKDKPINRVAVNRSLTYAERRRPITTNDSDSDENQASTSQKQPKSKR